MLEDNNHRKIFIGKVIEIKNDYQFVVEALDKKDYIIVDITKEVIFEDKISKEFLLGNIVIFETISSYRGGDYPLQYNVTKIIANEKDEVISIDIRETVSGYLGVFPEVVLDINNRIAKVKENGIVAIILKEIDVSYSYEDKTESVILINELKHQQDHYLAFLVKENATEIILNVYDSQKSNKGNIKFLINGL